MQSILITFIKKATTLNIGNIADKDIPRFLYN